MDPIFQKLGIKQPPHYGEQFNSDLLNAADAMPEGWGKTLTKLGIKTASPLIDAAGGAYGAFRGAWDTGGNALDPKEWQNEQGQTTPVSVLKELEEQTLGRMGAAMTGGITGAFGPEANQKFEEVYARASGVPRRYIAKEAEHFGKPEQDLKDLLWKFDLSQWGDIIAPHGEMLSGEQPTGKEIVNKLDPRVAKTLGIQNPAPGQEENLQTFLAEKGAEYGSDPMMLTALVTGIRGPKLPGMKHGHGITAEMGTQMKKLGINPTVQKWAKTSGEMPESAVPAHEALKQEIAMAEDLRNEAYNIGTRETNANLSPKGFSWGTAKFRTPETEALIERYMHDADLRTAVERGEIPEYTPEIQAAAKRLHDQFTGVREEAVKLGWLPKELMEAGLDDLYRRTLYYMPEMRNMKEGALRQILDIPEEGLQPNELSRLQTMKQSINNLLDAKNPEEFASSWGQLEPGVIKEQLQMLKKRHKLPPEAVEWLGGRIGQTYSRAEAIGDIARNNAIIKFARENAKNLDVAMPERPYDITTIQDGLVKYTDKNGTKDFKTQEAALRYAQQQHGDIMELSGKTLGAGDRSAMSQVVRDILARKNYDIKGILNEDAYLNKGESRVDGIKYTDIQDVATGDVTRVPSKELPAYLEGKYTDKYQITDKPSGKVTEVGPGKLQEYIDTTYGPENKWIKGGALREINSFLKTGGNMGRELGPIVEAYQKYLLTPWKKSLTIFHPKVQMANAVWNKMMSYMGYGPLSAEARAATADMFKAGMTDARAQAAQAAGILRSGFESEWSGPKGQTLLERHVKERYGKQKPGAMDYLSAAAEKPGHFYQATEIKSKAGILYDELKKKGYGIGKEFTSPDGRVMKSFRDFTKEDIQNFRDAGKVADYYMIDYANQPRAVRAARSTAVPFATFFVNVLPRLYNLARGVGHDGKFDAGRLARFWSVPGALKLLNALGEEATGQTPQEEKAMRDALDEGRREPVLGGEALQPSLPFRITKDGSKVLWGEKDPKKGRPALLPLGGIIPMAAPYQKTGAAKIPSFLAPGGPAIDIPRLMLTGKDPYTQKDIASKFDPNRNVKYAASYLKAILPLPVQTTERLMKAIKGEPQFAGEVPERPDQALVHSLTPYRPIGVDIERSDFFKNKDVQNLMKEFKTEIRSEDQKMQQRVGVSSKEYARWQIDKEHELLGRIESYLKTAYPRQYQSNEHIKAQWDQLKNRRKELDRMSTTL